MYKYPNRGSFMENSRSSESEGFLPVYKEIADIIGAENTYAIYRNLRGQQLCFPKRLYTTEYILGKVMHASNDTEIRKIAMEYDYTERYLKQLLKQYVKK